MGEIQRVRLDLESGSDPISGRFVTGDRELPFTGWLTLAAALESLRRKTDVAGDPHRAEQSDQRRNDGIT